MKAIKWASIFIKGNVVTVLPQTDDGDPLTLPLYAMLLLMVFPQDCPLQVTSNTVRTS